MPTYDYKCKKCNSCHEIFHSMNDVNKSNCPSCGENSLEKQVSSGSGIIFKGSGFYETDYKRKAPETSTSDTTPKAFLPPVSIMGWFGRKSTKWAATPMGPTPGPPPPCGMAKVLCRLRWHTSAPIKPGLVNPTWAFILAPSIYT